MFPPSHTSGRYYTSPLNYLTANLTLVAGTLYATPFYVGGTTSYSSININVVTLSAGKSIRLGVYTSTNMAPDALLLDAGVVSASASGLKSIAIDLTLSKGWYWLVLVSDGTPVVTGINSTTTSGLGLLGFTSGTDTTNHQSWTVVGAYAALPDPFTPGGALAGIAPRITLSVT